MLLKDIKVIELGQNLAGPYGTQILADLGAEVLKVERPTGDDSRNWGTKISSDTTTMYQTLNRNKKSISLDLRLDHDKKRLMGFLEEADIFLHNLRPGSCTKLGLGAKRLRNKFPQLIYCDVGAFGHIGPLKDLPGYEPLMQAYGGLVSINGHPQGPEARVAVSLVDLGTGMWSAIGALAALHHRSKAGIGCVINTSLYETALAWGNFHMAEYRATGKVPPRQATGHPAVVPYQAFDASDGPFMILAGNDRIFARLAPILGKPNWVNDPRFKSNPGRVKNRDAILNDIQQIVSKEPRDIWVERLRNSGVPSAPIQTIPQVLDTPQTLGLNILQPVPGTPLTLVGLPISINGERPAMRMPPPSLGNANDEIP
ncbi:MAG: carnitine dehydratase [Magnetovibrio sp.]|nr:carnitine dehydratase [Magnetovibrio sp.]